MGDSREYMTVKVWKPAWAKFLAIDKHGRVFFFEHEPVMDEDVETWCCDYDKSRNFHYAYRVAPCPDDRWMQTVKKI